MDRFFITGCTGFVARYFLEYLYKLDTNTQVLGVDVNEPTDFVLPILRYEKTNLRDKEALTNLLQSFKPNYVLHLASMSSVSRSWIEPADSFVNNTNIFLNLVESVRLLKLDARVLSVGSSEEYGFHPPEDLPLKECYELKPNNPYAIARASQEMLSKLYAENFKVEIVMTRSFNHAGPRQNEAFVIPSIVKQMLAISRGESDVFLAGNLDITRDFLDVRDVVRAYHAIIKRGQTGQVYNVCSGQGICLRDIVNYTAEILNISPKIIVDKNKIRPNDTRIIVGDNTKLRNAIDWRPIFSIYQTITDVIDYWKQS